MTHLLVIDVGTSGLRAAVVDADLRIVAIEYRSTPPSTPFAGLVEFDAGELATQAVDAATTVIERAAVESSATVAAVGITNQRASVVAWDRTSGEPVAAGLGWQDLRTVTECIVAKAEHGWSIAPNQSVTKIAWLLDNVPGARDRDLAVGTIDSWLAWQLTDGERHISDQTNFSTATTALRTLDGGSWRHDVLDAFGIPESTLPMVVDSAGILGSASRLPGAPPITAMIGDQQASLLGQGCTHPGDAKITFGTGGMLDVVTGSRPPAGYERNRHGTFPLPLSAVDGHIRWGAEGIMLSAGANVEWLVDDLGVLDDPAQSHDVAAGVADSAGVVYVPALLGLGTPQWDYGARGTLLGLTRGTERAHVVRAVLEGVAHRGADLVEAAEADTGHSIDVVRIDGGMSRNPTFVQALADRTGRRIEVAPVVESTTLGAAFLAGVGIGVWGGIDDAAELWNPTHVAEPGDSTDCTALRLTWQHALDRAREWYPELSALDF